MQDTVTHSCADSAPLNEERAPILQTDATTGHEAVCVTQLEG